MSSAKILTLNFLWIQWKSKQKWFNKKVTHDSVQFLIPSIPILQHSLPSPGPSKSENSESVRGSVYEYINKT